MDVLDRRMQVVLGIAGIVLLIASITVGVKAALGEFDAGYELTVEFERAGQGLDNFSDVRVRGVTVGTVQAIELNPDNVVEVRVRVQPDLQVPASATAAIEATSVFGPKFVSLDLGADEQAGPFLPPGATIQRDVTTEPTGIEAMLDRTSELFQDVETADLTGLVVDLAAMFEGQGARIGATIDSTDQLLASLHRSQDDVVALLANVEALAASFEDRGDELVAVAQSLQRTLPRLTGLEPEFVAAMDAFGAFTDATVRFLTENHELFDQALRAIVEGVLPALRSLASDLENVPRLTGAIRAFADALSSGLRLERPGGLIGALETILELDACQLAPQLGCDVTP